MKTENVEWKIRKKKELPYQNEKKEDAKQLGTKLQDELQESRVENWNLS